MVLRRDGTVKHMLLQCWNKLAHSSPGLSQVSTRNPALADNNVISFEVARKWQRQYLPEHMK